MSDDSMLDVLGRWKTAFDSHETDVLAGLFTPDALFQGFGPDGYLGPAGIRGYYDAVPDRSADMTILSTYTIGGQTAGGFADVTFSDPAWRQGGAAGGS
jgi:hypothetical protein